MSPDDGAALRKKAAVLLLTLGAEVSSEVFRLLGPEEADCLAREISCLDSIDPDEQSDALRDMCAFLRRGAEGEEEVSGEPDPARILDLVGSEHPQTIALVLSRIDPRSAAFVLQNLPQAAQADIARRIASMDRASPETICTVERVLESRLETRTRISGKEAAGPESMARILRCVEDSAGIGMMEAIEDDNPGLASAVRKAGAPAPEQRSGPVREAQAAARPVRAGMES